MGEEPLRLRNWEPFPVNPKHIDAVVISHAHLDHVGYLPAIVRAGFVGRVHSTTGTFELAKIVLTDSVRLQEEDAPYANRVGSSKHSPAVGKPARCNPLRYRVSGGRTPTRRDRVRDRGDRVARRRPFGAGRQRHYLFNNTLFATTLCTRSIAVRVDSRSRTRGAADPQGAIEKQAALG